MKQFFIDFLIFGVIVFAILYFMPKDKPIANTGLDTSIPDTIKIETVRMDTTKVDSLKREISIIARKLYWEKQNKNHFVEVNRALKVKLDSVYDQYQSTKVLKSNYGKIKVVSFGLTPADSIRISYQFDVNKAYLKLHPRILGLNKREWTIAGISAGVVLLIKGIFKK